MPNLNPFSKIFGKNSSTHNEEEEDLPLPELSRAYSPMFKTTAPIQPPPFSLSSDQSPALERTVASVYFSQPGSPAGAFLGLVEDDIWAPKLPKLPLILTKYEAEGNVLIHGQCKPALMYGSTSIVVDYYFFNPGQSSGRQYLLLTDPNQPDGVNKPSHWPCIRLYPVVDTEGIPDICDARALEEGILPLDFADAGKAFVRTCRIYKDDIIEVFDGLLELDQWNWPLFRQVDHEVLANMTEKRDGRPTSPREVGWRLSSEFTLP